MCTSLNLSNTYGTHSFVSVSAFAIFPYHNFKQIEGHCRMITRSNKCIRVPVSFPCVGNFVYKFDLEFEYS